MKIDYSYYQQTVMSSSANASSSDENNEDGFSTSGFENLFTEKYHCPYCDSNEQVPVSQSESSEAQSDLIDFFGAQSTDFESIMQQVQASVTAMMDQVEEQISFLNTGFADFGNGNGFQFLPEEASSEFTQAVSGALEALQSSGADTNQLLTVTTVISFEFTLSYSGGGGSCCGKDGQWDNALSFSRVRDMADEYGLFFRENNEYAQYANTMEQFSFQFDAMWEELGLSKITEDSGDNERDPAVEAFVKNLREKGARVALNEMNQEKIEKLLEERREMLEDLYGLNSNPPLPAEQRAKIEADIDKELQDYKKELMERFKADKNEEVPNRPRIPSENLGTLLQTV